MPKLKPVIPVMAAAGILLCGVAILLGRSGSREALAFVPERDGAALAGAAAGPSTSQPSPSPLSSAAQAEAPPPPLPDGVSLSPEAQTAWERLAEAERAAAADPAPDWPAAPADVPASSGPRLRSLAWYVVDDASGEVLAAHDAERPLPIASITKLASMLIWADSGADPEAALELAQEDKDFVQVTKSRLRVGARYKAGDLLHSSLLSSDNRATASLMRQTGLPREVYALAMERRAQALGLESARFGDPTGLDESDTMSARDAARLLAAAVRHEVVGEALGQPEFRYQRADRPVWIAARASNRLAHSEDWGVRASKTGYTEIAGSCLVMQARIAGRPVTLAFLGARGVHSRYGDAVRLRDWLMQREASVAAAQP
jgi:D-alanyl-D-alanine endopeptidase (penicillin-binding protein 7)